MIVVLNLTFNEIIEVAYNVGAPIGLTEDFLYFMAKPI
jgi:hypothetical protein